MIRSCTSGISLHDFCPCQISLQDIFLSEITHNPPQKSNGRPLRDSWLYLSFFFFVVNASVLVAVPALPPCNCRRHHLPKGSTSIIVAGAKDQVPKLPRSNSFAPAWNFLEKPVPHRLHFLPRIFFHMQRQFFQGEVAKAVQVRGVIASREMTSVSLLLTLTQGLTPGVALKRSKTAPHGWLILPQ